jgi:hypothetical protein
LRPLCGVVGEGSLLCFVSPLFHTGDAMTHRRT